MCYGRPPCVAWHTQSAAISWSGRFIVGILAYIFV